ncbi:MAG: class II fructose-bisphosphate aldolase, partial [Longicatena sp.]
LAVAIGTAHGIYPQGFIPNLKMNILQEITKEVKIPLVLHGGSNNPDSEIVEAIRLGVCKVNISSDYKRAMYQKLREVLVENKGWDPNNIFPECMKEAKKIVKEKMELFQSIDKANLYQNVAAWRSESL